MRRISVKGSAGASRAWGLNEDAADYPIRKFSLHFHRRTRLAAGPRASRPRGVSYIFMKPPLFQLSELAPTTTRNAPARAKRTTHTTHAKTLLRSSLSLSRGVVFLKRYGILQRNSNLKTTTFSSWNIAESKLLYSSYFMNNFLISGINQFHKSVTRDI